MVQLDWPRPPLVLGLVLGPLMEEKLFISSDRYGFSWLYRPGVLIILTVTLTALFYPYFKEKLNQRKYKKEGLSEDSTFDKKTYEIEAVKFSPSKIFSFFIAAVFAYALWNSRHWSLRAGLFPWVSCFIALPLAISQFFVELRSKGQASQTIKAEDFDLKLHRKTITYRTAGILIWIFAFFTAIWLLGFLYA